MIKIIKYPLLILITWMITSLSSDILAQNSQIRASADTSRILIGDQVNILLEVNQVRSKNFVFPVFKDTIVNNLEILSVSPIDTLVMEDRLKLRQHLVVTSFDTGFYVIPPFILRDADNDEIIKSNALPLEVLTIEIDTTKGITDIKLPFESPVSFMEILPYIVVGLLILAIAIFLWYYYKRRKKPEPEPIVRQKPVEPAHVWALRELDKLSGEKLWQKDKIKLFHSRLTDIIRTYIEFRFNIPALENTTSETVQACSLRKEIPAELCSNLSGMLELADLVKFAKWSPLPDENESSQQIAYDFVLKTKIVPVLRKEDMEQEKVSDHTERKEGGDV